MASILIVDDDPRIRMLLVHLLNAQQHQAVGAENGAKALERMDASRFDLIITDLRMPDMNGMELLAFAKKRDPAMPVILITAYASITATVEAIESGAFDYLAKPFKMDDLFATVGRALAVDRQKTRAVDGYVGTNPVIKDYLAKRRTA